MTRRTRSLVVALVAAVVTLPVGPALGADPVPTVSITADKAVYVAGKSADLTIVAGGSGPGKVIQVVATLASGQSYDLLTKSGSNDKTRHVEAAVAYNVKVRVNIYNDYEDPTVVATDVVTLPVRAKIATEALGSLGKSHSYYVYAKGAKPKFRTESWPARVGERCLRHEVQRRTASGWRAAFTSSCQVEGTRGRVDWTWKGKHPSKVKFRVRGTFAGDVLNRGNKAAWVYFKLR